MADSTSVPSTNVPGSSQDREVPKDIKCNAMVIDVSCHPKQDIVACADIDGEVMVYSYSTKEENHELLKLTHHKKSCRAVGFSPNGQKLFTVSKDKTLQSIDLDKGVVEHCIKKAHKTAPYSMTVVDDNMVATGDDDGFLKLWDMRTQSAVMEVHENEDFISDMVFEKSKRYLIATSGDGTLTSFDIRKHKMKMQSELMDSELLSLAVVKKGEKVVCGSGEGVLNFFNWGEFGNICDRFPGHPESIDCMVPISEDIIITGSIDGVLRAVHLLPNRIIGVVGEHEDFPVENMSLSHCSSFIASCSHDSTVKFWDVTDVVNEKVDGSKKARKTKPLMKGKGREDNFFSDLVDKRDSDKESDDSDMDSCEDANDSDGSASDSDEDENEDKEEAEQNSDSNSDAT